MSWRAAGPGGGRRVRSRQVATAKLIAIAIAISAVCMITLTAKAVITRADCSQTPVVVNVAASTDIAPAIQAAARAFNSENFTAAGRCAEIQVTGGDSAAEAGQIDGQAALSGATPIDAWIPDSSLWVDVARSYPIGAQNVQPTGKSVARSPLLLVTTPAVAASTGVFDAQPGWEALLPPDYGGPPADRHVAVDLPDPNSSAAGLATLIQVSRRLGVSATARSALTKFVFSVESTENFDSASSLQQFVQSIGPPFNRRALTVASEQAVLAYDRANPRTPLAAKYAAGNSSALGSPELDFPFVLTTSASAQVQAATEFGDYLQNSYSRSVIRYFGFRSPDGRPDVMPASAGLASQPLQLASAVSPSEAGASLQVWQKLGLGSRDLVLTDVSAAMNQPAGNGTQTVMQLLNATSSIGLGLFPDTTNMGLWVMGRSLSATPAYTELVSMGPLPADYGVLSRRSQLRQITQTLTAGTGVLALHDAILAAYKNMTQTYKPNYSNAVLVLTSGVDSAPGDMSLGRLVTQLRGLYNSSRKVELVILMFGQRGNYAAIQQIAAATNGVSYQITNPTQVGKVFIEAVSQRMCNQGCVAP